MKRAKRSIATDVNESLNKQTQNWEASKIIMNEWEKVLLAWSVGFINFPLFVVDIDRLPILMLLCLPQELQQNQRENVQSTKTWWRLLRLRSRAGKAAWPFATKSYALGSRKKVLLQCWKTGGMDAPVVFKGFLAFLFQEKNYFYRWLTETQCLEKLLSFFNQKNNNHNDISWPHN